MGSEQIVIVVFNVWIFLCDWVGKFNMEWYFMKIFEDGVFLFDCVEDQYGIWFNILDWFFKDQIVVEEFYVRVVEEFFEVIDDEDMIGILEGLIEFGIEMLKCLDKKYVESICCWLIIKYFFMNWLFGVIIYFEVYGMMVEYYIIEYGW